MGAMTSKVYVSCSNLYCMLLIINQFSDKCNNGGGLLSSALLFCVTVLISLKDVCWLSPKFHNSNIMHRMAIIKYYNSMIVNDIEYNLLAIFITFFDPSVTHPEEGAKFCQLDVPQITMRPSVCPPASFSDFVSLLY